MSKNVSWKVVVSEGLFFAFILFLLMLPLNAIIGDNALWPPAGQPSPAISAYQIADFAFEAVRVVVVLAFVGYALLRRNSPFLQTACTLIFGYGLVAIFRYASGDVDLYSHYGEVAGGVLTLALLFVSQKLVPAAEPQGNRKKRLR